MDGVGVEQHGEVQAIGDAEGLMGPGAERAKVPSERQTAHCWQLLVAQDDENAARSGCRHGSLQPAE
jgi:hypothetical protein